MPTPRRSRVWLAALTAALAGVPAAGAPPGTCSQAPSAPKPARALEARLGDPDYLTPGGRTGGARAPALPAVLFPRMGWPALVPYAGTVGVWIAGKGTPGDTAASFRAELVEDVRRPGGPVYDARPVALRFDRHLGVRVLALRLPAAAPRDTYDLVVDGPRGLHAVVPHGVRVYGSGAAGGFRFAFLADHQLWDPSWRLYRPERNAGDYPRRGEAEENLAITRQEMAEIDLLDPDFVLDGGDLIFGLDLPTEYAQIAALWRDFRAATYTVPGNHDGYATYDVHLDLSAFPGAIAGLVRCRRDLPPVTDWHDLRNVTWHQAAAFLLCAYGDITPILFSAPTADGLDYFRATFGPTSYSFDHGPLHVIGLNTYGGSPERRHSFAIYTDAFDLHLGAPAVDNYGGYLDDAALAWVASDAAAADAAGKTVLLFAHQDPRGNLDDPSYRYAENHPFPTDPLSLEGFQEWNYDGAWASDPAHPRRESPAASSGTRLLAIIAAHVRYDLTGHIHGDSVTEARPGDLLAPGVTATRPVTFLRVTTAASSLKTPHDYWGYRLLAVDAAGRVDTSALAPEDGLLSIPAGNFWATAPEPRAGGAVERDVVNGLPRPISIVLRFVLRWRPAGYAFTRAGAPIAVADVIPWSDGRTATYLLPAAVGATPGAFPAAASARHVEAFVATPRAGPGPVVGVEVRAGEARRGLAPIEGDGRVPASIEAPVGETLTLALSHGTGAAGGPASQAAVLPASAPASLPSSHPASLPAGLPQCVPAGGAAGRIVQVVWSVRGPAGNLVVDSRAPEVTLPLARPGTYTAGVTVVDAFGGMATASRTIEALAPRVASAPAPASAPAAAPPPVPPVAGGCACDLGGTRQGAPAGAVLLIFLLAAPRLVKCRRGNRLPARSLHKR